MIKLIDLTGQTFGKLTVINRADNHVRTSGRVDIMWNCKCDCGNLCTVRGERLRNGTTKSCGCYRTESLIANHKKYNDYDLSGEYGICYASNTGEEILFDLEDYDKIKDYCWYVQYTNKEKSYKRVQGTIKHGQYIKMHRLIIDCPNDCVVDHVNRNPLDNRKENLRVCSQTENMRNRKQNINNKLGIKGEGGEWIDNPYYDPNAPEYDGEWKNWNPKKIWTANNHGLGMGYLFDMVNEIYGEDFIRYKV